MEARGFTGAEWDDEIDISYGPLATVADHEAALAAGWFEPGEHVLCLAPPLVANLAAISDHSADEAEDADVGRTESKPVEGVVMSHGATLRRTCCSMMLRLPT